ncbi:MAG: hypothetical protein AMJ53_17495 [Gammaproteobacteria bacterium SG8_11]|nr:MAG: hypothetical protein AMJ53_17495 [Gammaproteobacteria bacterium SG8_11]
MVDTPLDKIIGLERNNLQEISIIKLSRNLGHQKAIAIGLAYIKNNFTVEGVVVMDSDGEDNPEHIPALIQNSLENNSRITVAQRGQRYESIRFRTLYRIFKFFFRILTGLKIDFGNFSYVPAKNLDRLIAMSELWAQYPATLIKSKLSIHKVKLDRGKRYAGFSKMSIVSLITHAMGGLSVFVDRVFVRLAVIFVSILFVSLIVVTLAILLKTVGMATPGWASNLIAVNILLMVQAIMFLVGGLLVVLRSNQEIGPLPEQSAEYFIQDVKKA